MMPDISQDSLHTPPFKVLNNGTFLTVIDSRRQALFTIQHPFRHAVQYTRTGNQLFLHTERGCTPLWTAPNEHDAQRVLDTLLRGLMNILRFRRTCLIVVLAVLFVGGTLWLSDLTFLTHPLLSRALDILPMASSLLAFLGLMGVRHSQARQKAQRRHQEADHD